MFFCILSAFLLAPLTSYAQAKYPFDLPAQSLAESLRAVGHQTSTNVMFEPRLVKGLDAPPLRMETTPTEAIRLLLAGTKLTALQTAAGTVLIQRTSASEKSAPTSQAVAPTGTNGYTRLAQAEANSSAQDVRSESQNSERGNSSQGAAEAEKNRVELEEIIVVGTNIHGVYPASSPVQIFSAEDIARTGATTTEQFIGKLPQNLGTRTQYAPSVRGGLGTSNNESVSSVDLRGLGVGTTLVLLNGRRLGLSSSGQAADVSLIPAGALQRVEVLTDGASAIYGSDAIGGVVNFVLRDDFDGAETRASYGGVTSGNLRQGDFTQMLGHDWASGNALVSYTYFESSPLQRLDRDFSAPAGLGTLTPDDTRHSALATLTQSLTGSLTLNADFAYSKRDVENVSSSLTSTNLLSHTRASYAGETVQYFANLGVEYDLTPDLRASIVGTYSKLDVEGSTVNLRFNRNPQTATMNNGNSVHRGTDVTAMLDGRLLTLPAGDLRFSAGGGLLSERYQGTTAALIPSVARLGRDTTYAFGELFVPLVARNQNIPWVARLELTLAARYTRFDDASKPSLDRDFGSSVSPKVGLLWSPAEALALRATYGESFRAPSLSQLDRVGGRSVLFPFAVAGTPSVVLQVFAGPAGLLTPENSESFTAGFDLQPTGTGFKLSATYFNISYTDRIGEARPGAVDPFQNPSSAPDLIYQSPSVEYVKDLLSTTTNNQNDTDVELDDIDAAAAELQALQNFWIVDSRYRNLALSEQDGMDVAVSQRLETPIGDLSFGANATRILSYRQQGSPSAPVVSALNVVLNPVDFRARVYGGYSRGNFAGTVSMNYVDDYMNTFIVPAPLKVDSWTTTDLSLAYDVGNGREGLLGGVKLSLSVQNLFDEDPPFVGRSTTSAAALLIPIGFDPANANPVGRLAVFGISKQW